VVAKVAGSRAWRSSPGPRRATTTPPIRASGWSSTRGAAPGPGGARRRGAWSPRSPWWSSCARGEPQT